MNQKEALQEALDEIQKNLTEIERLKAGVAIKESAVRDLCGVCMGKDKLITELCDELGYHNQDHLQDDLLRRAREATR